MISPVYFHILIISRFSFFSREEHDKRVAKEIADKLERDLQEQQQKELQESELIAHKMQVRWMGDREERGREDYVADLWLSTLSYLTSN